MRSGEIYCVSGENDTMWRLGDLRPGVFFTIGMKLPGAFFFLHRDAGCRTNGYGRVVLKSVILIVAL